MRSSSQKTSSTRFVNKAGPSRFGRLTNPHRHRLRLRRHPNRRRWARCSRANRQQRRNRRPNGGRARSRDRGRRGASRDGDRPHRPRRSAPSGAPTWPARRWRRNAAEPRPDAPSTRAASRRGCRRQRGVSCARPRWLTSVPTPRRTPQPQNSLDERCGDEPTGQDPHDRACYVADGHAAPSAHIKDEKATNISPPATTKSTSAARAPPEPALVSPFCIGP
jgi:hypothetical protein